MHFNLNLNFFLLNERYSEHSGDATVQTEIVTLK